MSDVTRMLSAIEQGDAGAAEQLLPLVYDEVRRLAAPKMAQEAPGQTLQAWSMTVTPQAAAASSQSTATATDVALLAWGDLDSMDDEETDLLTEGLVDGLALMLVE
jgi:hypothetical protein